MYPPLAFPTLRILECSNNQKIAADHPPFARVGLLWIAPWFKYINSDRLYECVVKGDPVVTIEDVCNSVIEGVGCLAAPCDGSIA